MLQVSLFVGFPISTEFEQELAKVNPSLVSLFTSGGEEYLESHESLGQRYFGKTLGVSVELARVELVRNNILSILRRLVPDFPYDSLPLQLVAVRAPLSSG